ncbi:hypothetical protein EG865_14430 [Enterococcus faecalis]|nr:hypothetical protein EG865_14430 [Enterococcus faecalis]
MRTNLSLNSIFYFAIQKNSKVRFLGLTLGEHYRTVILLSAFNIDSIFCKNPYILFLEKFNHFNELGMIDFENIKNILIQDCFILDTF